MHRTPPKKKREPPSESSERPNPNQTQPQEPTAWLPEILGVIQKLETIQNLQGTRLTQLAEELRAEMEDSTKAEFDRYKYVSEVVSTLREEQQQFQNYSKTWREQLTAHVSTLHQDRFEQIQKDLSNSTGESEYLFKTFAQELTALQVQVSEIASPQIIPNSQPNWKGDAELMQMLAHIQAKLTGLEAAGIAVGMETDMAIPASSGVHPNSIPEFNSFRVRYAQDLGLIQQDFQKVQQHLRHLQTQINDWFKQTQEVVQKNSAKLYCTRIKFRIGQG